MSSHAAVDTILKRIYAENPRHWPYGLTKEHFDGGLYLLSKKSSSEPVGFVGWQERRENGKKIGYYSVGILPEHRRMNYATRAVGAVLQEKAASVDEVRALIVASNEPSKRLAKHLPGVSIIEKDASLKGEMLGHIASALAGGTATMLFQDNSMHPDEPLGTQAFNFSEHDKGRNMVNLLNFGLGAVGGATVHSGVKNLRKASLPSLTPEAAEKLMQRGGMQIGGGASAMTTLPLVKDLVMDSHRAVAGVDRLGKEMPRSIEDLSKSIKETKTPNALLYGGLGLGAAGVGIAGLIALLKAKAERDQLEEIRRGRLKVTLPTKAPGDAETTIDLPTGQFALSNALQSHLFRDVKRRLHAETRQRTRHKAPRDPEHLTEAEKDDMALEQERRDLEAAMDKSSSAAVAVPSPPAVGTNPALRMSQQAADAQRAAQGASTAANPQIEQAQQDMANMQQQVQQEQMQRDQQMQQELAQKDQEVFQARQEVEIQKTQVDKAKAEAQLAHAKLKTMQELDKHKREVNDAMADSDGSVAQRMNDKRMERIRKMLDKSANLSQTNGFANLLPYAAQLNNRRGNELYATNGVIGPHIFRASYGKLGDAAYNFLARPMLMTPRQPKNPFGNLSLAAIARNPDAYDALMRAGNQFMYMPQ